jgi:hypothetical protein
MEEGKVRIDVTDPVGHEEQGSVKDPVTGRYGEKESREPGGNAGEPPDNSQNDTGRPGVHASAGHDENEELNWARKHIPEEPAAPHETARAPEPTRKPEPEEEPENPEPFQRMKPGRGKGRPPHRMLMKAIAIAKKRGGVIAIPGGRSDAFDMVICEEFRNVFVRFRWSATQYLSTRDVMVRYPRDVGRIIRMPLTGVTAWEFWLFEPGDIWQFFLFTHDGLIEIREDGTICYRPVLPVPAADSSGSSPSDRASGVGDGYGPGGDPETTPEEGNDPPVRETP